MGFFKRNSRNNLPPISNAPGWEGSDGALLHAQQIVYETARDLEISWFKDSLIKYMTFLSAYKIKVNNEDFIFVGDKTSQMWDTFRNYMMRPEINGRWNDDIRQCVFDLFVQEYSSMPPKYQPTKYEHLEMAQLAFLSIERCLLEDKQIVANAIFEVIHVLWCHHLSGNPNRRG